MTNIALVKEASDWIRANPLHHYQSAWFSMPYHWPTSKEGMPSPAEVENWKADWSVCFGTLVLLFTADDPQSQEALDMLARSTSWQQKTLLTAVGAALDLPVRMVELLVYATQAEILPRLNYLATHPSATVSDLEVISPAFRTRLPEPWPH